MVQGSVASGGEGGAAGLTAKGLDPLGLAMLAIPNQRVDSGVSIAKVRALLVRTGEPIGVDAFGELPADFSPQTRDVQGEVLALQSTRPGRRDDRRDNRLGCEA